MEWVCCSRIITCMTMPFNISRMRCAQTPLRTTLSSTWRMHISAKARMTRRWRQLSKSRYKDNRTMLSWPCLAISMLIRETLLELRESSVTPSIEIPRTTSTISRLRSCSFAKMMSMAPTRHCEKDWRGFPDQGKSSGGSGWFRCYKEKLSKPQNDWSAQ